MVLFCPTCGEAAVKNANYCVRCGTDLQSIGLTSSPSSEAEALPAPEATKSAVDVAPVEASVPAAPPPRLQDTRSFFSWRMTNPLFYFLVTVATVGVMAPPVLSILVGEKLPGNQHSAMVLWFVFLAYAIQRRGGRGRGMSLLLAVIAALGVALSLGFADGLVNRDRHTIEREWARNKALAAMKDVDPKAYDALRSQVLSVLRSEPESDERVLKIGNRVTAALQVYGQRTSDAALVNHYRAKHAHLKQLLNLDPSLCYRYAWGIASPALTKLPDAIRNENLELMALVIRNAGPSARTFNVAQAENSLDQVHAMTEKRLGKDSALIEALYKPSGDSLGTCRAMIAFSGSLIDTLSVPDAANVLRYMAQSR